MKARAHRIAAAAVLAFAATGGVQGGGGSTVPTRDAFDAERRRVAALESELALASTRKPYLVLDLQEKELRYRLLGMTLREVPLPDLRVKGLVAAGHGTKLDPPALAGIFTVREKDGDPRLRPLTPEQVEAGADDENVANVLPPEPPKSYRVKFVQPVVVRVAGQESGGRFRAWSGLRGLWDRLRGAGGEDDARLELFLQVDAKTGDEIYRSLIPDLRWLVLAPRGYALPSAGQEAPPKPKPPRAIPKSPPKPIEPPGVPFQIPTPTDEAGTGGTPAEPPAPPAIPPEVEPPAEPPPDEPPPPPPDDPEPGRP